MLTDAAAMNRQRIIAEIDNFEKFGTVLTKSKVGFISPFSCVHCPDCRKNIIAVAGAGLSAASGIPTFRGQGGLWRRYDAMSLATPEAFEKDPSLVWQFYNYRRHAYVPAFPFNLQFSMDVLRAAKAKPTAAHMALAHFSIPQVRDRIAKDSSFTLITQNVDGLSSALSGRALDIVQYAKRVPAQQPPAILEMHGRLFDVQCSVCEYTELNLDTPICESLAGTAELVENTVTDPTIPVESLPKCSKCSSLARPGVVWFGEMPQYLDEIDKLVMDADLCIVVGTSSTVSVEVNHKL